MALPNFMCVCVCAAERKADDRSDNSFRLKLALITNSKLRTVHGTHLDLYNNNKANEHELYHFAFTTNRAIERATNGVAVYELAWLAYRQRSNVLDTAVILLHDTARNYEYSLTWTLIETAESNGWSKTSVSH